MMLGAHGVSFVQAPGEATEAGGYQASSLFVHVARLRDRTTGAKLVSVNGKKMRGWRGWEILTPEEAEAAAEQQAEETEAGITSRALRRSGSAEDRRDTQRCPQH